MRRQHHGFELKTRSLTYLVGAVQSGDEQAWSELVRRLTPTLRKTLHRYDVDPVVRDDVAGEVWRLLFERLGTVRDPERLHGWIAVVTTSQLMSLLRRASRRREVPMGEETIEAINPRTEAPVDRFVEDEVRQVLANAVAKLSPREQAVIRCRAWTDEPESLSSMEQRHGIPTGSIGPTLGRGLYKLRRDPQLIRFLASA